MKALDCACYVVKQGLEQGHKISLVQLQRLLFVIAAEYQRITGDELITDDKFETWGYGPALPTVNNEFKCYANAGVPIQDYHRRKIDYQTFEVKEFEPNELALDCNFVEIVEKYLPKLLKVNYWYIVAYLHQQKFWMENKLDNHTQYQKSEIKFQDGDTLESLINCSFKK